MYIAKPQQETSNEYYELFEIKTIKDINDNDVQISQSIGTYSLADLETQKENLQKEIASIDEKINTIKDL
jgi:hypothetical protein